MIEQNLEIPAADGITEALLVRPDSSDPLPAVIRIIWSRELSSMSSRRTKK